MPMYMRFMSDLHLEFGEMSLPEPQPNDADTVLVLAGDVAVAITKTQYTQFILDAQKQFKHVIWIMGNHEHYGGSVNRSIAKIKRALMITQAMEDSGSLNVSIVENEVVRIEDVDFICATLWTDYANHNPLAMMQAQQKMNDYQRIRWGRGPGQLAYAQKLSPEYAYQLHDVSRKFIERSLAASDARIKVVVTHHAPSYQSIHERFRGDPLNACYASPLEDIMLDLEPDYWIHGHLHDSVDYNIGKTNILCNPRGYAEHEINPEFDPLWTIDLS